jgi:hypothetical protein
MFATTKSRVVVLVSWYIFAGLLVCTWPKRCQGQLIEPSCTGDRAGGNTAEVQRLGRKAILLSESPLINAQERANIRNRFRVNPGYAELLK